MKLLLLSGEEVGLTSKDDLGREPIELCSSISAVFKLLKREKRKSKY
jgi:hypothetical protein